MLAIHWMTFGVFVASAHAVFTSSIDGPFTLSIVDTLLSRQSRPPAFSLKRLDCVGNGSSLMGFAPNLLILCALGIRSAIAFTVSLMAG